jgi:dTDP-glucose 4,6-dehydratase
MAKEKIKKIIIIGSNSFSAGSLIQFLLKKNYKIYGISRSRMSKKTFLRFNKKDKNFIFKKFDLNKNHNEIINFIKKIKPHYIINYASQSMVGQSWDKASDWFYTNSFSTLKLYDSISKLKEKIKLIHVSTPEVYGNLKSITTENQSYNPTTPYAVSRVTADQFLKILFDRKKIQYCSIRASNVYGEHQRLYRIIPKTIISILKKEKLKLDGGGFSKRNFIHIDDVSEATYKIIKSGKNGEIYHISSDEIISIRNLVKFICLKMKYNFSKLVKIRPERPGKDKFYILSNKKLKKDLKWNSKITLDEGINRCIDWIKKDLKLFSKSDENYIHKK